MNGYRTATGEVRDLRPPSVRFQDAAIREYAVRNRLVRGRSPEGRREDAQAEASHPAAWLPRPPRRDSARTAARAEGIYRRIAPPDQEYPLRAVALVRRLLLEGAPEAFVQGKYRRHVRCCDDIGVAPVPLIHYLADLLDMVRLDAKAAGRSETVRKRSMP